MRHSQGPRPSDDMNNDDINSLQLSLWDIPLTQQAESQLPGMTMDNHRDKAKDQPQKLPKIFF